MSSQVHRNMTGPIHDMSGMSDDMANKGDLRNTTHNMQKSFYWGKRAVILFTDWPGDHNLGKFLLAVGFVFILATAAEVLSVPPAAASRAGVRPTKARAVKAALYAFRVGIAYLVMLSVMSFNVGIFVAAVCGHTLGYFLVKAQAQALPSDRADPKL